MEGDIIPHCASLSQKGINGLKGYPKCGQIGTGLHSLKLCYWARSFWDFFKEWFTMVYAQFEKVEVEAFSIMAWQVWSARNDFLHNKNIHGYCILRKEGDGMVCEYKKTTWKWKNNGFIAANGMPWRGMW